MEKTITFVAHTPEHPEDGLIAAMDKVWEELYPAVPFQCAIFASEEMWHLFKVCLREVPNRMDMMHDPKIMGPQYECVPVLKCELDSNRMIILGHYGKIEITPC